VNICLPVRFESRATLTAEGRAAVEALARECLDSDGFDPCLHYDTHLNADRDLRPWRLAWACAATCRGEPCRADAAVDDGDGRPRPARLVAAASAFAPLRSEGEISACVSPLFRHQGLFKALYGGLEASLCRSGARSVLLVCAARSPASRSIAGRLDAKLDHAELRMRLDPDALERVEPPADLRLVPVGEDDADDCSRLAATIFGDSYDDERAFVEAVLRDEARELFMAHGADGAVGMATITRSESGYELNGVGVLPEHRGKGYGAAIMDACLVVLRNRGVRDVTLEVDAANEPAMALYRSRGFAETARVDYWRLPTRCS